MAVDDRLQAQLAELLSLREQTRHDREEVERLRATGQRATLEKMDNTPGREEIDAKLAAAEARAETRLVALEGKIDRLTDAITGDRGVLSELSQTRADNKATRWTIIVTVIAAALSTAALVVTVQSGLLTALQTGLAHQ